MGTRVKVLADSMAPCGQRLITFEATYPRPIHAEIMTHKMLSKSSASSRAIPVEKLIQRIIDDPWIPDYIGANQRGMQPGEELSGENRDAAVRSWLCARDYAVQEARHLMAYGVHKGVINRLLEPWMHITIILSGTERSNFYGLRDHEMAEPHFQDLARKLRQAEGLSQPKVLKAGEWHLPFIDLIDPIDAAIAASDLPKVSVGRCARVSYLTHDGRRDPKDDIALHDKLMMQVPLHAAPAEHVAQALDYPQWFKDERPEFGLFETYMQSYITLRDNRAGVGDPSRGELAISAMIHEMQSGNYFGFSQYRKTMKNEHIGGRRL